MTDSILSSGELAADLFCEDLDRCVAFYRDTLGLTVEVLPDMGGDVIVHAGNGSKLGLHKSDRPSSSDHTAVSFLLADTQSAIDYLRSKGVKLEDYEDLPGGMKTVNGVATFGEHKVSWFKDPGGNILCVSPRAMGESISKAA